MSLNNPRAEIIAIGSEFLHGGRLESNSIFLAEGLAECGIAVEWKTLVGDSEKNIALAITTAVRRANVVIVTGGLGSTVDDCTREAVAAVTGQKLRRRLKAFTALKTRYAAHGRPLTKVVSRQAFLPVGAEMLENPVGSAPGFLLEWKRSVIIALPGVSKEAQAMFKVQVVPRLASRVSQSTKLQQKMFSTVGLTELQVEDRLQPSIQQYQSVQLSLLASVLGVTVVLRAWVRPGSGRSTNQNFSEFEHLVSVVRQTLGDSVYAEDEHTMETVVGQQLQSASLSLALAESCTGGLIGHRLTQIAGSSAYLDRSFVCYSNQAKQDLLAVPRKLLNRHGAVSEPVARAMAVGARKQSRADVGLSVTGIAGPSGGTASKPVGLVFIGIAGPYGTYAKPFQFYGDRQDVKMRASQAALNILRLYLLHKSKS
ncbi:MAG: competence/damage-inducible protein A [Nitrospirales bacterium]|nr:MAG: competence/damage-inducible protein A [Nitrospirales bacterium]